VAVVAAEAMAVALGEVEVVVTCELIRLKSGKKGVLQGMHIQKENG
jgi:hypothetical protein